MSRRVILLAAALTVCVPVNTAAQVQTLAERVCGPYEIRPPGSPEPDTLTRLYNSGDWGALQARARAVIDAAAATAKSERCDASLLDYEANYIVVTWIGYNPLKDKPQLMRVVVPGPATNPYSVDLPGIGAGNTDPKLVELFVATSSGASLASMYTSTREENPAAAQVPAFAQAVAGPLFGTVAALAGVPGQKRAPAAAPPPVFATIQRVGLPFRRASIRLEASARDSVDPTVFNEALTRLVTAVDFKEAAYSDCARQYAKTVAEGLMRTGADKKVCADENPDPLACVNAFDSYLKGAYKERIAKCGAAKDDRDAVQDVDQQFRALIRTYTSATAGLDVTFHNRPLTHWSFGAGSAVIGKAWLSKPRVRLDDSGNLQADPLTRVMTMAFVNWSYRGYDEQADPMEPSERWRAFFGAALTPDFGPVGGLNVALARGIGLTVGGGVLFAKGAEQDEIGKAPGDSRKPFRVSFAPIAFAGISYNFK